MNGYAELVAMSNFSFLRAASHPDELVTQAAALGLKAIALADWNTLAGIVRGHVQAKALGVKFIPAARLVLADGFEAVCLPTDRNAYGRLARVLTLGNRRAKKGASTIHMEDVAAHAEGQIFIALPPPHLDEAFIRQLNEWRALAPGRTYLGAARRFEADEVRRLAELDHLSRRARTPLVAVGDVLYHASHRRPLQDVLVCVREKTTIKEAGFHLAANAERRLKSPAEMARAFAGYEEALARTLDIADACAFSLDELAYEYPDEICAPYASPIEAVRALAWRGADERYPGGVPEKVRQLIDHELGLIEKLNYAPYFLTVHDIVAFARSKGILCQGRGSAANSAVCFCLGITSVNPAEIELLFERFVSAERNEPPDIDVDFEHERREEVIQYIYGKYGRERAAITATVQSYRTKGAIRDVGKALGLSQDAIGALSKTVWGWSEKGVQIEHVRALGLDPNDRTLALALRLARELQGFPRHLGQHPGGFVITRGRLDEIVPLLNGAMAERTFAEWDKDDLDALGLLKVDVLGLGMLTCIRKAFELMRDHYGAAHSLASIPHDDPAVYDMICAADTHGVFQIESRAQMSMLPRLRPRNFYDLVIEVAIVRPGPIQGDMVHPYLRRRQGIEEVRFPSEALRAVLGKTLGVPLFQEQAMKIAIVGAGFTPGEADQLRRAMAAFRRTGSIETFRERFVSGMTANGYDPDFAARCFAQIEGFGEYGFPESHAASFALLVYVSAWIKCHYPDVFTCAIINSQPMGFYSTAQLARDLYAPYVEKLESWGYEVRAVDVNRSQWRCTLELIEGRDIHALRLGFRLGKGLREDDIEEVIRMRGSGYSSIRDLYQRTRLSPATLKALADMDAFGSLGLSRRAALWEIAALEGAGGARAALEDLPLFAGAAPGALQHEERVALPRMGLGEHVLRDIATTGLSLKGEVMALLRPVFAREGFTSARGLRTLIPGRRVKVAGIVTIRQRPATASGVVFSTIEDEEGAIQLIIWPKVFEKHRRIAMRCRLLAVEGRLQSEQGVIHIVAERLIDRSADLKRLSADDHAVHPPAARADEVARPGEDPRMILARRRVGVAQRTDEILPKGRNFR